MLCRFIRESALVCGFLGPATRPDPILDHPYAKATTPDQLISAYCIANIARNFDDWEYVQHLLTTGHYPSFSLTNYKKNITFSWQQDIYNKTRFGLKVNDEDFDENEAFTVINAFQIIKRQRDEIEREAEAAKRRMEVDKKKWDFAETLLGMKRLPSGALVPKDYEEPENKFDPCPFSCCQKAPNQANCEGK